MNHLLALNMNNKNYVVSVKRAMTKTHIMANSDIEFEWPLYPKRLTHFAETGEILPRPVVQKVTIKTKVDDDDWIPSWILWAGVFCWLLIFSFIGWLAWEHKLGLLWP